MFAPSAGATTITINDTFADNHIGLFILTTPDTTNGTVSANCVGAGVNQWNCAETGPVVINADLVRSGQSLANSYLNIWDGAIGGTLSDTLSFEASSITPTTAHMTITFASGPGLSAFAGPGTHDFIEGPPLTSSLNAGRDGGSFTLATTPVPEPATLTLTVLGLAGAAIRRRRSRSAS
jgi:hypothetical protein